MKLTSTFPVFTIAYSIIYGLAEPMKWILFRFYPAKTVFSWTDLPAASYGPPINWYGWMAWAAIAGVGAALVALALPRTLLHSKVFAVLAWLVPLAAGLYLTYLARVWFLPK